MYYKIKCFKVDTEDNSANYADYIVKGEKGWKICAKPVEKPHLFESFKEANRVMLKLRKAYSGKLYFALEVRV